MSIFDPIAEDMRNGLQSESDLTPFEAVDPVISLFDQNPPTQALSGSSKQAANRVVANAVRHSRRSARK